MSTALGIEFGSTRIKAILTDDKGTIIAEGSHTWENELIEQDGRKIWSYSEKAIWSGLQDCYGDLASDYKAKTGSDLTHIDVIGFSAMMHGYLPFDAEGKLLVPFRTWRNTITAEASDILTGELGFNIPQRWSIAHLYQAILNKEDHVSKIDFLTTLAGFIHWKLTGRKVLGVGDASGMFPITDNDYDNDMLAKFGSMTGIDLKKILPEVLVAGENAGTLTSEGAKLLDPTGKLEAGSLMCPPEGDAGTGMTATNSISKRTGNVSAGTSVFAMVVMEKALSKVYKEIDVVTTPDGSPVAMVHCNNCTSEINAWANMLKGFADAAGASIDMNKIYEVLFTSALKGAKDSDGVICFNYFSGEPVTGLEEGRPLIVRNPDSKLSFENFARTQLMGAVATLKLGMNILKDENVAIDTMYGHGGYFKTPVAGQAIMAAALEAPVTVMETAGEGGAWGIALLALFTLKKVSGAADTLGSFLTDTIFKDSKGSTVEPDPEDVKGFNDYISKYGSAIAIEKQATESLKL